MTQKQCPRNSRHPHVHPARKKALVALGVVLTGASHSCGPVAESILKTPRFYAAPAPENEIKTDPNPVTPPETQNLVRDIIRPLKNIEYTSTVIDAKSTEESGSTAPASSQEVPTSSSPAHSPAPSPSHRRAG